MRFLVVGRDRCAGRPPLLPHLKGAVRRVVTGGMAFRNRQASHAITLDGVWQPSEEFGDYDTAWEGIFAVQGRLREGMYINFLGGDEDLDRIREAFDDSVYDRPGE